MKWAIAAFGACCLAALVATWPLMVHSTYTIPLGTELEATVPVFSLWTLWWNANRAAHGFHDYWDAPLFHPIEGTLAFSEPQLLTGILMAPLWALNVPPALIYNLALVAMLALNGFFTYRLARALCVPPAPALIAGVMAVTLPFAAKHLGVLPVLPLFGMAWTLEGLVRFGEGGSWRHALWAAAGLTSEFLFSQQLALLFAPFAALGGLFALSQRRWRLRSLAAAAGAGLVVLAVVVAVAEPARRLRARQGFERSEPTAYLLSASPRDFLSRPATAMVPVPPPSTAEQGDTAGLFPGLILLGLAVAGSVRGLRSPDQRRWIVFLLLSVLLALLLAMGLKLSVAGWRPFISLRESFTAVAQLRSPYRFAAVLQTCLPPLAALGLAWLWHSTHGRHRKAMVVLGLLAAAENLAIPVPLQAIPTTPHSPWTEWLRTQPASTVIAHVPFPSGLHVSDYEGEVPRLFAQMAHQRPMVNGYASFFPASYTRLQLDMIREFPSRRLLCELARDWHVDALVVDSPWLAARERALAAENLPRWLQPAYRDQDVMVFWLAPPAEICPDPGLQALDQ